MIEAKRRLILKHSKAWHARERVFHSIAVEVQGGITYGRVDVDQVRRVATGEETTISHPVIARILFAVKAAGFYRPKPNPKK